MGTKYIRKVLLLTFSFCIFSFSDGQAKEIQNLEESIEKASQGSASYQSDLVSYYYNNKSDYEQTIFWCNKILDNPKAEKHNREYAYRILGYCSLYGRGTQKSIPNAIQYLKKGYENEGANSASTLARIYKTELKDSVEAINWYKKAAELLDKPSALFLAKLFENGYEERSDGQRIYYPGVSKDISEAAKYYNFYISRRLWGIGGFRDELKLLYKLANWHYEGEGNLEKNYESAYGLLNEIANTPTTENKNSLSKEEQADVLWKISVCYRFGRGTEKDELKARRYAKRAAEMGNPSAIEFLGK